MYTIGVKRRFLPGFKRYQVTAHSWGDFRFILNLVDGSQLVVPGFTVPSIRVYPDFHAHVAQLKAARHEEIQHAPAPRVAPPPPPARVDVAPVDAPTTAEGEAVSAPEPFQQAPDGVNPEVYARATARVRGILQGSGIEGTVGTRSLPQ